MTQAIFKGDKIASKRDNNVYTVTGFSMVYYIVVAYPGCELSAVKRTDAIKLSSVKA